MLNYTKTSYEYTFDDKVQYCQILTVNVTAVNALGQSAPGSVSTGFPIGKNVTKGMQGITLSDCRMHYDM